MPAIVWTFPSITQASFRVSDDAEHPRRQRPQPAPKPEPASAASAAYQKLLNALAAEDQTNKESLARRFEPALNAYLETQSPGNADQKKTLA
jgi:hypothetical protein